MDSAFDIINCKENVEVKDKFIEFLSSGVSVLFIGSGTSIRLKYPRWEELLYTLNQSVSDPTAKKIAFRKIENGEILLAAEIIKNAIEPNKYHSQFKHIFNYKDPAHDSFHKSLVNLKCKAFITTNYDPVIEDALRGIQPRFLSQVIISDTNKPSIHNFIRSLSSVTWTERYLLYLHGRFDMESSTILSYGDYLQKYSGIKIQKYDDYKYLLQGEMNIQTFEKKNGIEDQQLRTLHYKTIYLTMASQRIIYIGYGLRDPFLEKIISDIQDDFHPYYDDFHYALISNNGIKNITETEYRNLRNRYKLKGIEVLFYDDDEEYNGMQEFIKLLPPACFIQSLISSTGIEDAKNLQTVQVNIETQESNSTVNQKLKKKVIKIAGDLKS